MNAAIVAHFNEDSSFDDNFINLVKTVRKYFKKVVVVSTSEAVNKKVFKEYDIEVIVRPNIGYDFYSYKVGFIKLKKELKSIENLLLINSSILLVEQKKFEYLLKKSLDAMQVRSHLGLVSSDQYAQHFQSYFVLIGKLCMDSVLLSNFIDTIKPLNNKIEIITKYECGLSAVLKSIKNDGISLYIPQREDINSAIETFSKNGNTNRDQIMDFLKNINWSHYACKNIAEKYGVIKKEVVHKNPFLLDIRFIDKYKNSLNTKSSLQKKSITEESVIYGIPAQEHVKTAVALHLFYSDLIEEFILYLKNIVEPFDIYISTPFESDIPKIINQFSRIAASVTVLLTENRGRDVLPFIKITKKYKLSNYKSIVKIHSKKSQYSNNGSEWRNETLKSLLGDTYTIRKIINALKDNGVGMVGPAKFYLTNPIYNGSSIPKISEIIKSIPDKYKEIDFKLGFFAGTMFWMSSAFCRVLEEINLDALEFEDEKGQIDGTMAHAFERIFCCLANSLSLKVSFTNSPSFDIYFKDFNNHTVNYYE